MNLVNLKTFRKKYATYLGAMLLMMLLSGCMSMQTSQDSQFDENNFLARGKIALRYPNCPQYRACEEEGLTASMDWTHTVQEDSLTFYDPLGQAQATLIYDQGQIIIQEDGQARTTNANDLAQELGIPLPIQSLRELILNEQHELLFDHEGWQVQVKGWQGQYYRSVRLRQDDYHIRVIIYSIE